MDDLLNNAPCGFLSFTDDGEILMINATLLDSLGYAEGELRGRHVESLLPVASRIFYQTHFFPLLRLHGKVEEVYLSLRAKSSAEVPVLVNAVRRERVSVMVNDCILVQMRQRNQYEDEILRAKKNERDERDLLVTILTQAGARVEAAATVTDALELLRLTEQDVLISDIEMPGEDGYSLIRKVRALEQSQNRRIPAIALTAHVRASDRLRALSAGYQMHMPKPVEPVELVMAIANLTSSGPQPTPGKSFEPTAS